MNHVSLLNFYPSLAFDLYESLSKRYPPIKKVSFSLERKSVCNDFGSHFQRSLFFNLQNSFLLLLRFFAKYLRQSTTFVSDYYDILLHKSDDLFTIPNIINMYIIKYNLEDKSAPAKRWSLLPIKI